MKVYWLTFERRLDPSPLNLGAGVTGRSPEDVRKIAAAAFPDLTLATLSPVEDLATLDQGHVVPNMGNLFIRGVWFAAENEAIMNRASGLAALRSEKNPLKVSFYDAGSAQVWG